MARPLRERCLFGAPSSDVPPARRRKAVAGGLLHGCTIQPLITTAMHTHWPPASAFGCRGDRPGRGRGSRGKASGQMIGRTAKKEILRTRACRECAALEQRSWTCGTTPVRRGGMSPRSLFAGGCRPPD
ncbi:hypothetical protein SEVIR_7G147425v4 [Setaria viridis]